MKRTNGRYSPRNFASRAGVTVRALHHYDHIGLLRPAEHTAAGFRIYRDDDFVRLQQIVTLKFIGFPLKEIKRLLDRRGSGLEAKLKAQRRTLEEKRRQLDSAIRAIASAEKVLATGATPVTAAFQKITEAINMQNNTDWTKQYYNQEAQKLIDERGELWNPELQKKADEDWTALYRDIEEAAASGADPLGPKGRSLVERQNKLVEGFTGGNPAISEGLGKLWADKENWPQEFKEKMQAWSPVKGTSSEPAAAPRFLTEHAEQFFAKACDAMKRKE